MLCNICKQNRASFQKFMPSVGKSVPVCSACLTKSTATPSIQITQIKSAPGFYSIKQTITPNSDFKNFYDNKKVARSIVCTNCGYDLVKFERTQRMGCSECYTVFEQQVKRMIG